MAITDWPADQRPRERLIELGASTLSDAELLAVFLRMGVTGKSAVDLGRDLLAHFGSINGLFAASLTEFSSLPGLGPAKYAQLQAVVELARRALREQLQQATAFESPRAVADYLQLTLGHRPHEVFLAMFLDAQHRLIEAQELFRGTLTQASVYPREVVKAALANNAAAVIFAHNHPSGHCKPSEADRLLTHSLTAALGLVDVRVLDHFIVAGNECYSFAEHGILNLS